MKEDEFGIQPCCIDKKLPQLIKKGALGSFFFSQGDWGLSKLWNAVSLLVPSEYQFDSDNHIVGSKVFSLLVMKSIDEYALRLIRKYLERYWIEAIAIIVNDIDKEDMVRVELHGLLDRVCFIGGRREALTAGIWIRATEAKSLVICGPIGIGNGNNQFCQYSSFLSDGDAVARQAIIPYRSILRLGAAIKGNNPLIVSWVG